MWKLIAACLVVAAASLLLPSEPSYDPLAWLIWGRELAHFGLDTAGGPSWKPLPVAVTTLLAPLAELEPGLPQALWMVIARAGALLALAFAFRLASGLAGGGPAGALGGLVAAGALLLTPDWLQFAAHGSEAPIAVALMLRAVERHLDGWPGNAFVLGTLACLLRPELFAFLAPYGAWVWWARPHLRPLLAGVLVLLPVAWIGPEWIGSGAPLDGGAQARSEPAWSLSLAERPWLRALERVHNHAGLVLELLGLVAVAVAVVRRRAAVLALAAAALAEAALFVAMTQAGFSGNPRYVLPALAITAVLAGVGTAHLAQAAPALLGERARWRLAGVAVALGALALVGGGFVDARVTRMQDEAREVGGRMELHRDLAQAVREVGGADAVAAFGSATSNRALHTRLAYELGVPIELVESLADHRVIFRSSRELLVGRVYMRGRARFRETLARVGSIRVYRRDGITFPRVQRDWNALRAVYGTFAGNSHSPEQGRIAPSRVVTR
jgi:hypothetical protein